MISLKILIINAYNILNILFTEVIDGIKMTISLHLTNHIVDPQFCPPITCPIRYLFNTLQ